MKKLYSDYINDEFWLIKEDGWEKSLQKIRESQLSLGNGYLGARSVLEELPYDSTPGTYVAGIYDKMGSQVAELVNLPNPINFKFSIEGEKFDLVAMDFLEHKRALNMKKALLTRHTIYRDSKKRCYDYQSLRFVSLHDKNIGAMQVAFTPLDSNCELEVNTGIDTSIYNSGGISEGRKRHFRIKELAQSRDAGYIRINTLDKKHEIVYWAGFYYEIDGKKVFAKDNFFTLNLKQNQTVIFTKVFWIKDFPYEENRNDYRESTYKMFCKSFRRSFRDLLDEHVKAWEKLWDKADILIGGTANLQQNLRFNIYHMLIASHCDNGFSSIGARTLSGEGYHGHIFWDAEIFLMPFYLFNFPKVARNMLLYRYRRINEARKLAKKEGFRGAKFPWESADTGEEETPEWARDIDRTIIRIHTHQMEHHITSDIAYALYKYYVVTNDEDFMEKYGYEMLFETARFWASRVEYNEKKRKYEINRIIGPDEFRISVNNNAYTNMMAKWNLVTAYNMHCRLKKNHCLYKDLKEKLNLKEKEAKEWKKIAPKIAINVNKKKVIEEFDGYFKLRKVIPEFADENGIPILPPKLKAKDLGKTQLVKQADVLMLLYLLDDVFSSKTKIANYEFYMPRTVHKSSLSPSIHAIFASFARDMNKAYNLFNVSLRTDISNLFGNTHEGIHAAALGGTWQAVVFGFAGVSIQKEKLFINPRVPQTWKKTIFSLHWKGNTVNLELANDVIKIKIDSRKNKDVKIGIFNKINSLRTNKIYVFKRRIPEYQRRTYHY
ncbi:MAG: glycoside hydrolase family 65 protein [Candidatus Omnitrophica bacterium]|nr:glycoside hydrolase family 65 protein [Candidatus Omnitrophota bacterium]MBU4487779.1 glycoside hydrolase family 65 protein [Candidatus Omnitrophota bacterium]